MPSAIVTNFLWAFLEPSRLIILVVLTTGMGTFWRQRFKPWFLTSLLIFGLTAFTPLGALPFYFLERAANQSFRLPNTIDGIIVLAGAEQGRLSAITGQIETNDNGDRLMNARLLWHRHPSALFIHSGNGISTTGHGQTEVAQRYFSVGVPDPSRLIWENVSQNTRTSARTLRDWVKPQPDENWVLITSAYHMPRALDSFRRAGWAVSAYPVDHRLIAEDIGWVTIYPLDNLILFDLGMHEWVGRSYYAVLSWLEDQAT